MEKRPVGFFVVASDWLPHKRRVPSQILNVQDELLIFNGVLFYDRLLKLYIPEGALHVYNIRQDRGQAV